MLIHLGWVGSDPSQSVLNAVDAIRAAAPKCEVMFHDNEDIIPVAWRNGIDRMRLNTHMRSDIQRHCVLKKYGGLWLDLDVHLLADPADWPINWSRYTATKFANNNMMISTDIIYVPKDWLGWFIIDNYINDFFDNPPAKITLLQFAGQMIAKCAKIRPDYFEIVQPGHLFPYYIKDFNTAAVVARGFDPATVENIPEPGAAPAPLQMRAQPGLGDMVADGLTKIGITKERVQAVASAVGIKDCGCSKRQEKLNQLGKKFGIGVEPKPSDS